MRVEGRGGVGRGRNGRGGEEKRRKGWIGERRGGEGKDEKDNITIIVCIFMLIISVGFVIKRQGVRLFAGLRRFLPGPLRRPFFPFLLKILFCRTPLCTRF